MQSGSQSSNRVSVIVGTFNRAHYIEECLDSLLAQTRPIDEIVVVDDGSTDDTPARVRRYGDRVRYLQKENGGRASALNYGLEHSSGDWVWFFDDDDVAEQDALERMLAALAKDPSAEFAYSSQTTGRDGADGRIRREHAVRLPNVEPDSLFHYSLTKYPFRTQGMLIRRRCFAETGAFDLRYLRGQDYEFCIRLLRRFRGTRVEGPTFIWRVHDGPRGPQHARHEGTERGQIWMKYEAIMGRELRQQLSLGEYLNPPRLDSDLAPVEKCSALIQRMAVMASKGLIPEMLEDLQGAARICRANGETSLSAADCDACWTAGTYDYFLRQLLEAPGATTSALIAAGKEGGRGIIAWLGKGMLWACRGAELGYRERWLLLMQGMRLMIAAGRYPRRRAALNDHD